MIHALANRQLRRCAGNRIGSNPHRYLCGFNDVFHLDIPKPELIAAQGEFNPPGFAGSEGDALEAFQFPDRARHAGTALPDIKLHNLIGLPAPGIFHLRRDTNGLPAFIQSAC